MEKHIDNTVSKAYKTLGFIRRNLGRLYSSSEVSRLTTVVRLVLEYYSTVWDPHQTSDVHNREQVQRRAARFVHRNYTEQTPGCVTNMVQSLGWESLQHRRFSDRLCCSVFRMVWSMSLQTTSIQTTPIREVPNVCVNFRQPKRYTSSPFTLVLSVIGIGFLPLLSTSKPCRNLGKVSQASLP